jgi:oligopeptide transport system ATP-binding protein
VALLQSIPQLGEPRDRLPSIAGEPPDLARLPAGCPFHPRCDAALDLCRTGEPPPVFTLAQDRQVRCWLREQDHDRSAAGSL